MYSDETVVEFEDLETFVAIVDHGSMRGAATARAVTPSLISRRLAGLEARLGVVLVVRTTRSLSLTDAGRRFEAYAREILGRVTDAVDDMQGRGSEPRGLLRIAASHAYGTERVAPLLAEFLVEHPKVQAELVLDDVRADLIGHGFDAAIRIGTLQDSELVARPLEPYVMGLFAAPAYLQRAGVPTSPAELRVTMRSSWTQQRLVHGGCSAPTVRLEFVLDGVRSLAADTRWCAWPSEGSASSRSHCCWLGRLSLQGAWWRCYPSTNSPVGWSTCSTAVVRSCPHTCGRSWTFFCRAGRLSLRRGPGPTCRGRSPYPRHS